MLACSAVVLTVEQPCEVVMAAGGLPAAYRLEQIHFHWRSEHTLRGKRWVYMLISSHLALSDAKSLIVWRRDDLFSDSLSIFLRSQDF
jgi:hypothetical protein